MDEQYIVTVGNLADGITFTGPFADMDEAHDWALDHVDEWQIVPLTPVPEVVTWHINVYERGRCYGGPEEGGWWYDTGVYQPMMSTTFDKVSSTTKDEVTALAQALQRRLNDESAANKVPLVGSTQYNGGRYLVMIQRKPGADFPADRPVYQ